MSVLFLSFMGFFLFRPLLSTHKKNTSLHLSVEAKCAILAQIKSDYIYLFLSTFEPDHKILWENLHNNILVSKSRYLVLMLFPSRFKNL